MLPNGSLYGNFRQVSFSEVYPDANEFYYDYQNIGIKPVITNEDTIKTLYYLLYASYGNSTIANSDTTQFKYKLYSIIFSYGPTWEKRLEIQENLRQLLNNPDELFAGTTQINNQAFHDGTAPSTLTTEELKAINSQFVTKYKKDKLTGYSTLMELLETDVTTEFINRFAKLFIKIVQPELPLWYVTETEEGDIIDG